ncbi:MAG: energy transducer TonB, partial [Clostridia bacterium]|nr:energy transducer TonB [Clostridia bacterium]
FFNRLILTRFDLLFVPAAKVQTAAGQLGIPLQSLAPDPATNSVWAQGTPLELRKLQELIHVLDRPVHDLSLDYRTLHLTTISPERARQILTEAGIKANYTLALKNRLLVFDTDTFARWAQVEALIKAVDNLDGREDAIFAYQLKNISAQDAEERLGALPLPVTAVTFNYPDLTQEILVICPSHLESQVRSALSSIDSTRKKIRVPVHNSTIHEELNATRSLLSELSGVSVGNMHISRNLSGDSDAPYYVLWVEETPERIAQIEVLIEKLK